MADMQVWIGNGANRDTIKVMSEAGALIETLDFNLSSNTRLVDSFHWDNKTKKVWHTNPSSFNRVASFSSHGQEGNNYEITVGTIESEGCCYDPSDSTVWVADDLNLTLTYDNLTVAFTVGETITGGTSTATATVLLDSGSVLTLGDINNGPFVNNDALVGDVTGRADASAGQVGGQTLRNRSSSAETIISTIDLNALGLFGTQDVCYDQLTDSFWLADNTALDMSITNITKDGVLISANTINHAALIAIDSTMNGDLQAVEHDPRDDTFWIAARTGKYYHITKAGVLIRTFTSPTFDSGTENGPTAITLVPTNARDINITPIGGWRMTDNQATAFVSSFAGDSGTFVGGNTEDKAITSGLPANLVGGFQFDASNDYFTFGTDVVTTGEFSLCAWVNPDSGALSGAKAILGYSTAAGFWRIDSATGVGVNLGGGTVAVSSTVTIVEEQWQHIVLTRDLSGLLHLYINGVDVTDGTPSLNPTTYPTGTFDRVGVKNGATQDFDGGIAQVMIIDYILDQAEVDYIYNSGDGRNVFEEFPSESVSESGRTDYNSLTGGGYKHTS